MMSITFIDYPVYVPLEEYDKAIHRMTEKLKRLPGVVSIYQIGSVNTPGISDIDMLVVFENGVRIDSDPREDISRIEKYLFIHGLFGVSRSIFSYARKYTFFHNYRLLYGESLNTEHNKFNSSEKRLLKIQIALEYLLKMHIALTIQKTYKIIKLRSLLLEAKAILYDLQFLDIKKGKLIDLLDDLIKWRKNWFGNKFSRKLFLLWLEDFHKQLSCLLESKIREKGFYMYDKDHLQFSRNVYVCKADKFYYKHRGWSSSSKFAIILGKRYYNLNHKFNRFTFFLPYEDDFKPDVLEKKANFESEFLLYNRNKIPKYLTIKSPFSC